MKKRVGGGIVVGAILLGILIGQFWKLPGLGPNETTAPSAESTATDATQPPVDPRGTDATETLAAVDAAVPPPNASGAATEPLVTVVVVGNRYRLTRDDDSETGVEIPLPAFIERAAATTGNAQGIRVRILLHESAQGGAHSDLLQALRQAGIRSEQIQEKSDFVK